MVECHINDLIGGSISPGPLGFEGNDSSLDPAQEASGLRRVRIQDLLIDRFEKDAKLPGRVAADEPWRCRA